MSEEIKNVAEEVESTSSVTKSKAKRDARKAAAKADKAQKNFDAILGVVIGIIVAVVVVGIIIAGIVSSTKKPTVASANYSTGISAEGRVPGAKLDTVEAIDFSTIKIPYSQVEYIEDRVTADIDEAVSSYSYFDSDPSRVVEDGHTINLDYSGSIDGVAFEGGTSQGATLVIGSGSFIDNFEEQLIGAHPGDEVEVHVTFPDPYQNNPDLAGKPAVFACKVNSIYTKPELTDEFVKTNFTAIGATSIAELRAKVKEIGETSNLESYLADYIMTNAKAGKVPSDYVKALMSTTKYADEQTYQYYNSYYSYYYGQNLYESFNDFTQMTDEEYEAKLKETATQQAACDMLYEKIFDEAGLTVSEEMYNDIVTNYGGESAVETYGEPFLKQVALKYTVIQHVKELVTIEK